MEKISVIIPVFNCKKYLSKCLQSIVNQTYPNLEIIIVDDGSTDGSSIICDEYARKYQEVIVLHQENSGPGAARNAGLDRMTGKYLTYVDADDYISKKYIEDMVEILEQYQADIVETGLVFLLPFRNTFDISDESIICFDGKDVLIQDYFSRHRKIRNCTGGRMYNIEKFKDIRFSNKSIGEDSEYSLKMLSRCERLIKYNKCLYVCRAYQESLTRRPINSKHFDVVDVFLRDLILTEKMGIKLEDYEYVFSNFISICYGLLETLAIQKKEKEFVLQLENMILVYEEIMHLAEEEGVSLQSRLVEDILHIEMWAKEYRDKNRYQLLLKCVRRYISQSVAAFKVKISYEYKIDKSRK